MSSVEDEVLLSCSLYHFPHTSNSSLCYVHFAISIIYMHTNHKKLLKIEFLGVHFFQKDH